MTEDLSRVGSVAVTLHWRVKNQVVFFYEVATEALAPLVPPELELQEVRPGISVCALEMLHYKVGHFREGYREFYEAVFAAAVQPDLSLAMPVPRFAMAAIKVISDSTEFCSAEAYTIFTPTHHVPGFRIEFSPDGTSCQMFDGDYRFADCRNTAPETPFKPQTLWGQYFTHTRGLHRGIWRWDGRASEHMKGGDHGQLSPHLLFGDLDVAKIGRTYRQMAAKPEETELRFYHAGLVPTRRRGELDQATPVTST
jgi:hypothetical protein